NQATFLMLDGLADGTYQLHLSGPNGLADFGGNPLVGNDPSGDYVTTFQAAGPPRGSQGDPLTWKNPLSHQTPINPQMAGVPFTQEVQAGVTLVRSPATHAGVAVQDATDYYQVQVLQSQTYFIAFTDTNLPSGLAIRLTDTNGNLPPNVIALNGGQQL